MAVCSSCCFCEAALEPPADVEMLVCSSQCATGDLCLLSGWLWPLLPHALHRPRLSPLRLHPLGSLGPAPAAWAWQAPVAPQSSTHQRMLGVRTPWLGQASAPLMARPRLRSPASCLVLPAPRSPSARPSPAHPCLPALLVPPPPLSPLPLMCFIPIALLAPSPSHLQVTETPAAFGDPGGPQRPRWPLETPAALGDPGGPRAPVQPHGPQPAELPHLPSGWWAALLSTAPKEPPQPLGATLPPAPREPLRAASGRCWWKRGQCVSLSAGCSAGSRRVNPGSLPLLQLFPGRPRETRLHPPLAARGQKSAERNFSAESSVWDQESWTPSCHF